MTRDEAIKIMSRIWGGNPQHDLANSYVDAFAALGMLKLDEPKNERDVLVNALTQIAWMDECMSAECARDMMNIAREALRTASK